MKNETLKRDLCARLMEGVKGMLIHDLREDFECEDFVEDIEIFNKGSVWTYEGFSSVCITLGEGDFEGFLIQHKSGAYTSVGKSIKPILFPTSALTKEIQIASYNNGEPFVPLKELMRDSCFDVDSMSESQINEYYGAYVIDISLRTSELLNRWHINYHLSPEQFIEVTDEFNPYK